MDAEQGEATALLFGTRQPRSHFKRKPWSGSQNQRAVLFSTDKSQPGILEPDSSYSPKDLSETPNASTFLRESSEPCSQSLRMEGDSELRIFQRRKKQKPGVSSTDSGSKSLEKKESNSHDKHKQLSGGTLAKASPKDVKSNGFNVDGAVRVKGQHSISKGIGKGFKGNDSQVHYKVTKKVHTPQSLEKVNGPKTGKWKRLSEDGSPFRKSTTQEARRQKQALLLQEMSDDEDFGSSLNQKRAFSGSNTQTSHESEEKGDSNTGAGPFRNSDASDGGSPQPQSLRKSSRVPKKRIFDGDDEMLESRKRQKKKIEHDIHHYDVEDMQTNDTDTDLLQKEEAFFGQDVDEKGLPLTARQRALKLSKEGGDQENTSTVEFPDGLDMVLPKKQKETLTEAEQAIRKEEAARKRKQQMEKNAKQIQENAIQKILGQESSRKKREEKILKQRQELEQEKQAALNTPAVNSIRWVMGPTGNIVSFSQDVELSKIFSGPCSYPQEREKCAGPSCNNTYKYRDSKTRLPLCSLQCYKAVQATPNLTPAF